MLLLPLTADFAEDADDATAENAKGSKLLANRQGQPDEGILQILFWQTGKSRYLFSMIQAEELVGAEWAEWYRLTPMQRWRESQKIFAHYLAQGGSLDPDPDPDSPFYFPEEWRPELAHGRAGLRVLRRGAS